MTTDSKEPGASVASRLDRGEIDHIAQLAALSLSDTEAQALAVDLAAILRHVEALRALDTTDVPPTAGIPQDAARRWRDDVVEAGLAHEEALAAAPRTTGSGFAVPVFVDPHAKTP